MQETGVVLIRINATLLKSEPGATINFGGFERTDKMVNDGELVYSEKPVPAEINCTIPVLADTNIDQVRDFKDGVVTFQTDTGRVFVVNTAFTAEPPELTGDGGGMTCVFKGKKAKSL